MSTALVVGGSVAGLAAALALRRIGYDVLVLERSDPPPDGPASDVAGGWYRPTVPQAQHSHTLTSLGMRVLRERAPDLLDQLLAEGAVIHDLIRAIPPGAVHRERIAGDADLVALGCRRTTLELVLYRYVRALPGIRIRHRTVVRGLLLDPGRRTVRGVRTSDERLSGAFVVDATGRNASARDWLRDAGVPIPDDTISPSGIAVFTRFYRRRGAAMPGPLNRGNAAGGIWDHYAGVLHPSDKRIFSIGLGALPGDREFGRLRQAAAFTAVARATPGLDHWLADEVSEPLSAVRPITSPPNTLRAAARYAPVAGLFPVGDAAGTTNPLFGRGVSLALTHAFRLADLLAGQPQVGKAQARSAARLADGLLRPWYEHAAEADRDRIARWLAAANGTPPPAATGALHAVSAAAGGDGLVWRGLTRMLMSLTTPAELLDDERFMSRVAGSDGATIAGPGVPPARDTLVRAMTAATGAVEGVRG